MCRDLTGRFRRSAGALRRPGPARDDLLLIVKGVIAAVAASWLTAWLAPSSFLAFAPFTALLAVQGTLYRSVWDSARYLGALTIGVALAGGFGLVTGPRPWALALLVAVALIAGRARWFGAQRTQAATVALFAFLSGGGQPGRLMDIVLAIAIGLTAGVVTDFAQAPLARYGDTRRSVLRLSDEVAGVLRDVAEGLREERAPSPDRTEEWVRRAARLAEDVPRAYAAVERGEEKVRLNPRRVVTREPPAFPGYRVAVGALGRVVDQLGSLLRGLGHVSRWPGSAEVSQAFIGGLPALLSAIEAVICEFGGTPDTDEAVRTLLLEAWERHDALATSEVVADLERPGEWPVYGGMLTDAARILQELDNARRHAIVPGPGDLR